jgi:hypothetical protein
LAHRPESRPPVASDQNEAIPESPREFVAPCRPFRAETCMKPAPAASGNLPDEISDFPEHLPRWFV